MSKIKTKDVTQFLRDMLSTTLLFGVDAEDYVIDLRTNERYLLTHQSHSSPILLYQEEIKDRDALVLNPLAEGLGQTPTSLWFYRILKASTVSRIEKLCRQILLYAIEAKKTTAVKKDTAESHMPMALLTIASTVVDDVDDKVLDELSLIFAGKEGNEFLSFYYQKSNLRTILRSGLFDPEDTAVDTFKSKFGKNIRKKSWSIFTRLLLGCLGISNGDQMSKFDQKADSLTCVRLSSLLNVLLKVYQEINPLLGLIGDGELAIDLTMMAGHIMNLSDYADNARFMIQPEKIAPPANQSNIPGMTTNIPMPSYAPPVGAVTLIPGPTYSDGRQGPPIPMYQGPAEVIPQPVYVPGYPQQYAQPVTAPIGNPWQAPPSWQQPATNYGGYQTPPSWGVAQPNTVPFDGPYRSIGQESSMQGINLVPGMPGGIYR